MRPPQLRLVLLITAVRPTTTTSACAATVQSGRLCSHRDFGLCSDWPSRPSVRPRRRRPVRLLRMTAVGPTTTSSACSAIADHGRPSNHHDFGLWCDWPERPLVRPPRLRPVRDYRSRTSAQPPRLRAATLLPIMADCSTATTSACVTDHHGQPSNHHVFGLCSDCSSRPSVRPPRLWLSELLTTAARAANTASACAATAQGGRPSNHHDFGLSATVHGGR